ncbi:MAG: alpha-amylase family glycosyl hydrolase, partial [Acidobacteriota bacterium]
RSPYHGWYRWADEPHDYLGPWGQRVWHQLAWWQRGWQHFDYLAYYGVFSPHMPDLDLRHPQATQAIHAVARFWLEEMRADGFRLDAARHLIEDGTVQEDTAATHDWLRRFFAVVKATAPDAVLVGEIWAESEIVATYGPDQVDLTFQFDLATAIVEAVRDRRADGLARALQAIQLGFSSGRFATFLSNHDQVRVLTQLAGDRDGARLAASLLLTLPGVPFIYYGEEIGMVGSKPDPRIRTPMQWTSGRHAGFSSHRPWQRLQLGHDTTNVENELADPGSLLHHYRRLIRLRNARPSLHLGTYRPIATGSAQLFAFLRRAGAEATLVVVHLGDEPLADYRLDVGPSDLTGAAAADLASGLALPPLAATGYRPIDRLAPHTAYLIALGPGE